MLARSNAAILFRFHDNPDIARERLKILEHFNPQLHRYALYGGLPAGFEEARAAVSDLVESVWQYPERKEKAWKWQHNDLMLKAWYRAVGQHASFDFLYVYDYDMLIAAPLGEVYPNIDDHTVALTACELFTPAMEAHWSWTSWGERRRAFLQFCEYLHAHYGIKRQRKVCLGPGPLFSRPFLEAWSKTEDIEYVHDELAYPAYAEALGFATTDNHLHAGFTVSPAEERYFNCESVDVSTLMILEQLALPHGVRAFHPVKHMITLGEIVDTQGEHARHARV